MARLPRFFMPELVVGEVMLDGNEAHHLLNVRRLRADDDVELFDGNGTFATAKITQTTRRDVELQIEALQHEPRPEKDLTLAIGFPKPDRARWLVEKTTELGVSRLVPLVTEHSGSSGKPVRTDKLRQYVIDACKQSRRNHLLQLGEPIRLPEFVDECGACLKLLADQNGERPESADFVSQTVVFIGPEAGFTQQETDLLIDSNARRVRFSQHILRVETAAVAAAAKLL